MSRFIVILGMISYINCIWPPEYKVDLKHEEEFIISDLLDRSDVQDIYDEEELIREEDLKTLKLHENLKSEKYFRLHGLSNRKNLKIARNDKLFLLKSDSKPFPELNPDVEDSKPWVAGFVDKNTNLEKDEDTIYFDDEAKSNKTNSEKLEKRNVGNDSDNKDYNYEDLKAKYDEAVRQAETKNNILRYKEIKEEETPNDAVKTLVHFKPENCSEEENSGLGFGAVKCLWIETHKKHLNKDTKFYVIKKFFLITLVWIFVYVVIAVPLWCQYGFGAVKCLWIETHKKHLNKDTKFYVIKKFFLITLVWIFVYVVIAVPLWCQYGWCCCCCRCKFCNPRDEIEEIKTYYANNPPGVFHDEEGNLKKYKATTYEIYAQKNLGKAIERL